MMLEEFSKIGVKLNEHSKDRLTHNLNVPFEGTDGKAMINSISKKIAISAGSACILIVEPSHVLLALGHDEEQTYSSIRIGCGGFTTENNIKIVIDEVCSCVKSFEKIRGQIC